MGIARSIADVFRRRPLHRECEAFRVADEWYRSFKPADGRDYSAVWNYAKERLREAEQAHDALDKKAEWYFGLAAALDGAIFASANRLEIHCGAIAPSFVTFVAVMAITIWVRAPGPTATPASIRSAVEHFPAAPSFEAWASASAYCAVVGKQAINDWKAGQLRAAAVLLTIGVALLLLPLALT